MDHVKKILIYFGFIEPPARRPFTLVHGDGATTFHPKKHRVKKSRFKFFALLVGGVFFGGRVHAAVPGMPTTIVNCCSGGTISTSSLAGYFWPLPVGTTVQTGNYVVLDTTVTHPFILAVTSSPFGDIHAIVLGGNGTNALQFNGPLYREGSPITSDRSGVNLGDHYLFDDGFGTQVEIYSAVTGQYGTVGGGRSNTASNTYGTVAGGDSNLASGIGTFVGGGGNHNSQGSYSTVSGGKANYTYGGGGGYDTVSGGLQNSVAGAFSVIGGGYKNAVALFSTTDHYNTIAGGNQNTINTGGGQGSHFIGGGSSNTIAANFNASTIAGGLTNTVSASQAAIVGGSANTITAQSHSGFIGGGSNNTINSAAQNATIGGGQSNTISGVVGGPGRFYQTIGGGFTNSASGDRSTIAGGNSNTNLGLQGSIGGGVSNKVRNAVGTVAGGSGNTADGQYDFIGAGQNNISSATYSTISGGTANTANADYATVGGGRNNSASTADATISGGHANSAGLQCAVGGGDSNVCDLQSVVGGGATNTANGSLAVVGGGSGNEATGNSSGVGGGTANTASGIESYIGGGSNNVANTTDATVGGGNTNSATGGGATVIGGDSNVASGSDASVIGGNSNLAQGAYSVAAGRQAKASANGSFVFADSSGVDLLGNTTDQFLIRAAGGVQVIGAITQTAVSGNYFTNSSSVNASAFFGNGAALTGIPSTNSIVGVYVQKAGDTMTGQLTNTSTITVKGNAFSVGTSTFTISGAKLAFSTLDTSGALNWFSGASMSTINVSGITMGKSQNIDDTQGTVTGSDVKATTAFRVGSLSPIAFSDVPVFQACGFNAVTSLAAGTTFFTFYNERSLTGERLTITILTASVGGAGDTVTCNLANGTALLSVTSANGAAAGTITTATGSPNWKTTSQPVECHLESTAATKPEFNVCVGYKMQ